MKTLLTVLCAALCLSVAGCGNLSPFSPRIQEKIDNQQGQIDELENNQNSMKLELGNLQSHSQIQDSELNRVQQGLANVQSNNENSGVQILSGPGGLIVGILGILAACFIALYYRRAAILNEKAANIMAEQIVAQRDARLQDRVFQAVMHSDAEAKVLELIRRHQIQMLKVQETDGEE